MEGKWEVRENRFLVISKKKKKPSCSGRFLVSRKLVFLIRRTENIERGVFQLHENGQTSHELRKWTIDHTFQSGSINLIVEIPSRFTNRFTASLNLPCCELL